MYYHSQNFCKNLNYIASHQNVCFPNTSTEYKFSYLYNLVIVKKRFLTNNFIKFT